MTEIITKNTEYTIGFNFKLDANTPKNLTGYNILIQIRPYSESTKVLAEYTHLSPYVTFTPVTGNVSLTLPPSVTGAFTFSKGVMDILAYNTGDTDGDRSAPLDVVVNWGVSRPT